MAVEVGHPAPEFSLKNHDGEVLSKSDLLGKSSLIVFIPFPFTGVCESEMCSIRDNLSSLNDHDANVVVITCSTRFTNKKWHDDNDFGFPVLSDFWPHGATTRAYGCFNEATGAANRATFVLDGDGIVRDIITTDHPLTPREFESYTSALTSI
ncbi:MAG: redoxin domain-containing protein [Acidimicrobiia bacterium]|nr:redoxin domain-containing protein [Acidimicrobiia bacterium]NNF63697.1 redoxin domain-containing protein [Acidimicrobiia bacterium]